MSEEDNRRLSELRGNQQIKSICGEKTGAYETGVTLHCDKHGDYPEKEWVIGGRKMPINYCMKCNKEKNDADLEEIKTLEEKNKLKRERAERERAGVSVRNEIVRFKHFIVDTKEKKTAYDSVYDMARKVHESDRSPNLIMTGKVGTGKTMLGNCAINALFKSKRVKIIKLQDMLRHIKGSYSKASNYSEEDAIKLFAKLDLLILDEVGVSRDTDSDKNLIFDVLDDRYQNMLPTMIISNLNIDGIKEILGERVVDRLRDGGGVLVGCDWESFRK